MVTKMKFIWFLLRNKALIRWYKNFKDDKEYSSLENLSKRAYPTFWIGVSFLWGETVEGYTYWYCLNKKWKKQFKTKTTLKW